MRLEALPGARSVALTSDLPGLGGGTWPLTIEGDSYATPRDYPIANGKVIKSGFFDALGVSILKGRDFAPTEPWDETEVLAIVNESFVRNLLGDRPPLGMRVKIGRDDSPTRLPESWVSSPTCTSVAGSVGSETISSALNSSTSYRVPSTCARCQLWCGRRGRPWRWPVSYAGR